MGRYNFTALRVRKRALQSFEVGSTKQRPIWYKIASEIPPAQVFVRNQPQYHRDIRQRVRSRDANPALHAPSNAQTKILESKVSPNENLVEVYEVKHARTPKMTLKPRKLAYQEDELRKQFYQDHPWELARPRIVVERDGEDASRLDWSQGIEQHKNRKRLDGESVVQRQLHLLSTVPNITSHKAYAKARLEFYAARYSEDVERRVAQEEARHTGAQFQPNVLHWGMTQEDKMYDDWERWARHQVLEKAQKRAAFSGEGGNAAGFEDQGSLDDVVEDSETLVQPAKEAPSIQR